MRIALIGGAVLLLTSLSLAGVAGSGYLQRQDPPVTENQQQPRAVPELVRHVPARVPENLKGSSISETVGVQVVIAPDGHVVGTVVFTASTPALADAATEAVRQWEYKPTMMRGVAVYAIAYATVQFQSE